MWAALAGYTENWAPRGSCCFSQMVHGSVPTSCTPPSPAGGAGERPCGCTGSENWVPEGPPPVDLWIRISPFRFFLKSGTLCLWVADPWESQEVRDEEGQLRQLSTSYPVPHVTVTLARQPLSTLTRQRGMPMNLQLTSQALPAALPQSFSTGGASTPQGTFCDVWRHFLLSHLGRGCYWHLVGKGHGCCKTSYVVQDRPPQERMIQAKTPTVPRLRNPDLERGTWGHAHTHTSNFRALPS